MARNIYVSLYLKEENYKTIKASIFKGDLTIPNVCESNDRALKCMRQKQNVTECRTTQICNYNRDFKNPFSNWWSEKSEMGHSTGPGQQYWPN